MPILHHQRTREERYIISYGSVLQLGVREIARKPNRPPSTVAREHHRNATTSDDRYRAVRALGYALAPSLGPQGLAFRPFEFF